VTEQLTVFKSNLETFASYASPCPAPLSLLMLHSKYKKDIAKTPDLRRDFHRMCANIGVDPLACLFVCLID
jgi:hypothetical protein